MAPRPSFKIHIARQGGVGRIGLYQTIRVGVAGKKFSGALLPLRENGILGVSGSAKHSAPKSAIKVIFFIAIVF